RGQRRTRFGAKDQQPPCHAELSGPDGRLKGSDKETRRGGDKGRKTAPCLPLSPCFLVSFPPCSLPARFRQYKGVVKIPTANATTSVSHATDPVRPSRQRQRYSGQAPE